VTGRQHSLGIPSMLAPDERGYQAQVLELLEALHWRAIHTYPLRTKHGWKTGVSGPGCAGFPDVLAVKDGRLLAAELKSAKGRLTQDQQDWLRDLAAAGAEVHVWRSGTDSLQQIARVLQNSVGDQANAAGAK
jgi:hypothetical protein